MPDKDKEEKSTESSEKAKLTQLVRDFALTGLATVFMTEDSVRKYLKELKLPKELIPFLLENIGKKKDDLYGIAAKEIGRVFSKLDISKEAARFLQEHRVHIDAKLSFEKKHPSKDEK